jgi:hypothetical protein
MEEIAGKLTQALSSGTLEEVVNGGANNDTLAAGVHGETTNLNTVTASNVLDEGSLASDLDKLLTSVAVLVDVADVAGSHLLVQGDADGVLET